MAGGVPDVGGSGSGSDLLSPLLEDEAAIQELKTHMPAAQQDSQDVADAIHSAQLRQNLGVLSQAVYSDQLPVLFSALGLSPWSSARSSGWREPELPGALLRQKQERRPAPAIIGEDDLRTQRGAVYAALSSQKGTDASRSAAPGPRQRRGHFTQCWPRGKGKLAMGWSSAISLPGGPALPCLLC